ncbi:porin [Burkholderia multivorans]|uniref:porin n=1 Tax=Burkholderia multivorans TaxID=87883 RepID=UPI000D353D7D|nr:porin [Burkholderia multivorans]MBR8019779.1 porin [Burkholderia multivorans]MEB2508242.1 porin [Burkholderia multivorans]MEB2520326.1 porin [Burkholderia multivorans]MEB2572327.1 porin [Burkholderia multivorans]MEB2592160.1 porin [Burkholderia multivorans]
MKIGRFAAAVAALGCAHAYAQTSGSVTLYGTVDTGILYSTNQQFTRADGSTGGGHAWQMGGGNLVPSRFGFQGAEPLGGGLDAVFTLEQQFLSANGQALQGGTAFSRQAWIGLRQDGIGTLGLGRQYDSYTDMLGAYVSSNNWATPYGSHLGDVDNLNAAFNFNNAVKFTSADFRGLTFGGTFSFGGQAGDFAAKRGYSLAATYSRAPVALSVGYLNLRQPLDAALGGANGYIGDFACSNPGAMFCLLQDARSMRAFGAGGSLTLGAATIALTYTHTRLDDSRYLTTAAQPRPQAFTFDIGELNVTYLFTPALQGGIAYIFNAAHTGTRGTTRFHQLNVGANYSLSKRTALYAVAIGQLASGTGLGTDANGQPANNAQIPVLANSNSNRQLAVMGGIRVNF